MVLIVDQFIDEYVEDHFAAANFITTRQYGGGSYLVLVKEGTVARFHVIHPPLSLFVEYPCVPGRNGLMRDMAFAGRIPTDEYLLLRKYKFFVG